MSSVGVLEGINATADDTYPVGTRVGLLSCTASVLTCVGATVAMRVGAIEDTVSFTDESNESVGLSVFIDVLALIASVINSVGIEVGILVKAALINAVGAVDGSLSCTASVLIVGT